MITSKLYGNLKILTRYGFYYHPTSNAQSVSICNVALFDKKDNYFKSGNIFCRQYHPNSLKLLNRSGGIHISQRYISTEKLSMQSGIFTYLSECSATNYLKQFVVSMHDSTGLPWWATVIVSTFMLRTLITLPLAAYQAKVVAKIENITLLEMPEIAKELQKETTLKAKHHSWAANKANLYYRINLRKQYNTLIVRDNCHPFKSVITVWFQLPTWIFFSTALRNLAYMLPQRTAEAELLYMKLAVGGFLWIPNLTQPDGLLILPLLLGLSNLAIIEIQTMMRLREPTRIQRIATNFFRCFSVLLVPISATVPAILCLYWTTSSMIGLVQNLLLMSNRVRKIFRIPDTPTTLDHPYQQLLYEVKEKNRRLLHFLRRKT